MRRVLSLTLLTLAMTVAPALTGQLALGAQVRFRTVGQSMIVVPVMINGAGPFDFQLDTGGMSSIVDEKLAEELNLPSSGRAILEAARGEAVTTVAHIDSIAVADAIVTGIDVLVVDRWADHPLKIRGVLGENFLQNFDVYIDNRQHLIRLEKGPGQLGERLIGERLPLSVYGSEGKRLEPNRLVIVGQLDALGHKDAKLQLDSGIASLLLLSHVIGSDGWNQPITFPVTGALGGTYSAYAQTAYLRLGKRFFSGVTVILSTETITNLNVDGLLPTSLFHAIFISHSGRFVILNPSVRAAPTKFELAKSKFPSGPSTAETSVPRVILPNPN